MIIMTKQWCDRVDKVGEEMNSKEKMQELIKQKQNGGGKAKKMAEPKNDRKNMRNGPKIFN